MLILLGALACVQSSECAKGFEQRDDGLCYEIPSEDSQSSEDTETGTTTVDDSAAPGETGETAETAESGGPDDSGEDSGEAEAPLTLDDLLDDLGPCEPGSTDGRLDLLHFCADDVCVGDTAAEAMTVLGGYDERSTVSIDLDGYTYSYIALSWSSGLELNFADPDNDGGLNPEDTVSYIEISPPWDGGTPEGLGPGASLSCFVDSFGRPGDVDFDLYDDIYGLYQAYWGLYGLSASDIVDNRTGEYPVSDGYVDHLVLYGP